MRKCSDNHGEIYYDGTFCPTCQDIGEIIGEIDGLENTIEDLKWKLEQKVAIDKPKE